MALLAPLKWELGDPAEARAQIEQTLVRADDPAYVLDRLLVYFWKTILESLVGNAEAALHAAEVGVEIAQRHGTKHYLALGQAYVSWARARLGDGATSLAELRAAMATLVDMGNKADVPRLQGLLAELEAERESVDEALARVDAALALARETRGHVEEPFLHRIRGEFLLKRDPVNPAAAEESFLAAIGIAQHQKARSFELRAALSLAKLYQSSNRAADGHAVLAPAIEGFSPTPEFPEIEQAQTLLAALAETDEVKNAAVARQRRLKLQTSYGQALMWSKGYASEETKAAVSRARELAGNVDDPSERFATYYGQWAGHLLRAELNSALETATAFLGDAENAGRPTEAAVAQRFLGLTILWQSDFIEASARLNEALRIYDSERDHDAKFRFGTDTGAVATVHLAQANWILGNVDQARELMQEAVTRAGGTTHAPTVTNVDYFRAVFEVLRGDTGAALRTADSLLELTRQHGISVYATLGTMCSAWVRAQLGDREASVAEFREALATYTGQGNKGHVPLHQGLLAELEADGHDTEAALTRMDAALALAGETGEHWTDSFLHRVRGEILLKLNPANTAPVEEALLTAIAIAQQQKAQSFELRAALSLGKLYQNTRRAADAHAVLAPALEGFASTPEFPEIEEAQALLATLQS
jgi:predicted ATPase